MNVIFLGYRDWAINTFDKVQNHNSTVHFIIIQMLSLKVIME